MRCIWATSAFILATATGPSALASGPTPPTEADFMIDAPASIPSGPQTHIPGAPILMALVRSAKAVELDAATEVTASAPMGSKRTQRLEKGQVLAAAANRAGVYCPALRKQLLYDNAPCLIDENNDGLFEKTVTAGFTLDTGDDLAITEKGHILPVDYFAEQLLAEPVPYHEVDYRLAQAASAELRLYSNYRRPDRPAKASIRIISGNMKRSPNAVVDGERVDVIGGTAALDLGWITVRILGANKRGYLLYQFEQPRQAALVRVVYKDTAPPIPLLIP